MQAWRHCLPAVEIDEQSLPNRCALDSTVLFLALEHKPHRSGTDAARTLWKALLAKERLDKGARVYIPALVVAELSRGATPAKPPRVPGVHVAPLEHALPRYWESTSPTHLLMHSRRLLVSDCTI
jgi:predicted nucleic acid-binding protein